MPFLHSHVRVQERHQSLTGTWAPPPRRGSKDRQPREGIELRVRFRSVTKPGPGVTSLFFFILNARTLIYTFHRDCPVRVGERGEQTVISDAEFVLVRAHQASEVMVRILGRALEPYNHTTRHPRIEPL